MKIKSLISFIGITLCLITAHAMAGPHGAGENGGSGIITQTAGYFKDPGGEYTVRNEPGTNSLLLTNSAYAPDARGVDGLESFQTFCVEHTEYLVNPMNIFMSTENIDGTPGSHSYEGGTTLGDDLDPRTAYLYTQFATGVLSNYDYTPGYERATDAAALQTVIWTIEEEISNPLAGQALDWFNEADDAVNVYKTWKGIGSVRVLQMYDGVSGNLRQDQLYLIPVPGAVLLGILGLGVVGIKLRKYT